MWYIINDALAHVCSLSLPNIEVLYRGVALEPDSHRDLTQAGEWRCGSSHQVAQIF